MGERYTLKNATKWWGLVRKVRLSTYHENRGTRVRGKSPKIHQDRVNGPVSKRRRRATPYIMVTTWVSLIVMAVVGSRELRSLLVSIVKPRRLSGGLPGSDVPLS